MRQGRFLRPILICAGLALLVWFVFGQTVRFDFVNYDDREWIVDNPHINRGLTREGVRWAFSRFHAGPLSSMSHMLNCNLYGDHAWGHHLTNVLLHLAATVVLFLALRCMTGALWLSAFVAALFAIHPLRAESVAWVTERKDVLSGLFFALALLTYAGWARTRSRAAYLALLLCFALGLLAKGTLVMLPLLLFLLDYWPLQRWKGANIAALLWEKVPLFVMSGACAFATYQTHASAVVTFEPLSLTTRLSQAVAAVFVYVRQTIFPAWLSPFYPVQQYSSSTAILAVMVLLGISAVVMILRQRAPELFVGWFWYLLMLLPVSGVVQIAAQTRADRYTYLPQIGLWIAIVWGADRLVMALPARRLAAALAVIAVIAYAVATRPVTAAWANTESLWTRAIAVDPNNDFARTSLSDYFLRNDRLSDALSQAQEALRANPRNAEAHNNLALAFVRMGRTGDAVAHWEQSLALNPENLNARCNLASILAIDPSSSTADGARAVQLVEPVAAGVPESNPRVWQILSMAYARAGRFDEAVTAAERGRAMVAPLGNSALTEQFDKTIAMFRAQRPFNDRAVRPRNGSTPSLLVRPQ